MGALLRLGLLLGACAADEVLVNVPSGGQVGLSTRGSSAFRVRLLPEYSAPLDSPLVSPDEQDAAHENIDNTFGTGIASSIGLVLLSSAGELLLLDANGVLITKSKPLSLGRSALTLSTSGAELYGRGASPRDATLLTASHASAYVKNRETYVPYYYSTDGYAALGVGNATLHNHLNVSYSSSGGRLKWTYTGAFELYLMPAATLDAGTRAYFRLTGAPRVPPRYAFGFTASRWGWEDRAYIEETLNTFRSGQYPIDAFICDFEWFANTSDYDFLPEGEDWYEDFNYNPAMFPDPREQLASYLSKLDFRMGGIRKPRLGNTALLDLARSKGWMLPPGGPEPYGVDRWLSFSDPAMRTWYGAENEHFLRDGVDFWWNDEGENGYFVYYWWNVAQIDMLRSTGSAQRRQRRFYSLNRAFIPGMARLGATVWTGDINASWEDLERVPGMMLNWGLAGAPYSTCDIGGFSGNPSPALLTRWLQVGIFLPMMRVHSTLEDTPHWPWLFGDEEAVVMRQALELRYRLVPYHYSLAHAMFAQGSLWMRPLVMEFPDDATAAALTTEWLDGQILVSPVLRKDSNKHVYLPAGTWYMLGSSSSWQGPVSINGQAALGEVPAFVRAGSVVPLAPVVQHTGALPGGPLEVQVYGGADGSFELVEDDGESVAYEGGDKKTTLLTWSDATRTLNWTARGAAVVPKAFTHLHVTLFDQTHGASRSIVTALSSSGSIRIEPQLPRPLAGLGSIHTEPRLDSSSRAARRQGVPLGRLLLALAGVFAARPA